MLTAPQTELGESVSHFHAPVVARTLSHSCPRPSPRGESVAMTSVGQSHSQTGAAADRRSALGARGPVCPTKAYAISAYRRTTGENGFARNSEGGFWNAECRLQKDGRRGNGSKRGGVWPIEAGSGWLANFESHQRTPRRVTVRAASSDQAQSEAGSCRWLRGETPRLRSVGCQPACSDGPRADTVLSTHARGFHLPRVREIGIC
jgi:hypothetical protein